MPDSWTGRTALVTGGLGFIGSNLALELARRGAQVTIADLPSAGTERTRRQLEAVPGRVTVHHADIRDADSIGPLTRGQDAIFCLAGQVSHPISMQNPLEDLDLNCRGQLVLLEACRRENPDARLVYSSTRQVYGRPRRLPVDEEHPVRPVDVNGVSKLASENLFRLYYDVYGLKSVSLRLTNTYGPRMDLERPGRGFINVCLASALRGEPVVLFGTGQQRRDFTYVDDVVKALLLAAEDHSGWGESFNLSHPEPCSLSEFVRVLGQHLPLTTQTVPFPVDRLQIDVGDYSGCSQRFRSLTGWYAQTGLDEGLRRTVHYFQSGPHPSGGVV